LTFYRPSSTPPQPPLLVFHALVPFKFTQKWTLSPFRKVTQLLIETSLRIFVPPPDKRIDSPLTSFPCFFVFAPFPYLQTIHPCFLTQSHSPFFLCPFFILCSPLPPTSSSSASPTSPIKFFFCLLLSHRNPPDCPPFSLPQSLTPPFTPTCLGFPFLP